MTNKSEIKIARIEIQIGTKVLSLTLDEMKELRDILNETWPQKEIQYIPYKPHYRKKLERDDYLWWESNLTVGKNGNSTLQLKTKPKVEYMSMI